MYNLPNWHEINAGLDISVFRKNRLSAKMFEAAKYKSELFMSNLPYWRTRNIFPQLHNLALTSKKLKKKGRRTTTLPTLVALLKEVSVKLQFTDKGFSISAIVKVTLISFTVLY